MDSLPKAANSFSTVSFTNLGNCPVQSGKNSNDETAHCQFPGNKEQLRQELLDAVKAGTLGARQINMCDAESFHTRFNDAFKRVLNFLPMPLKAATLNQQHLPTLQHPFQDILKLVANPDFSHQHLWELTDQIWELIDQDAPVQRKFLYQGEYQTILDLLIESANKLWYKDGFSRSTDNKCARGIANEADMIFQLFTDLIRRGVSFSEKRGSKLLREFCSIRICCYLKALGFSCKKGSEGIIDLWFLMIHPPLFRHPAVMLEFHQRCQRLSSTKLQDAFHLVLRRPFEGHHPYDQLKNYLLALFHYGEPDEQIFSAVRKKIADTSAIGIENSLGTLCADDYIHWVKELWERRDQEPFYQNWSENIKTGQQQIVELQKSIALTGGQPVSLTQPTYRRRLQQTTGSAQCQG